MVLTVMLLMLRTLSIRKWLKKNIRKSLLMLLMVLTVLTVLNLNLTVLMEMVLTVLIDKYDKLKVR